MTERAPIGKWVRGFGYRFWEGPCLCGSGEEGHELYDKMDIYAGITCKVCKKEFSYAPGVMPGSDEPYPCEEPIDED